MVTKKTCSTKAAKKLAVAYQAFSEEFTKDQHSNGTVVWAGMLIEAQEKTGIELHTPGFLRAVQKDARSIIDAREQSAAA